MATNSNENPVSPNMYGRTEITVSDEEVNRENVAKILEKVFLKHKVNSGNIDYLYRYYKGEQPIIYRVKEVRPEIMNKIIENRANALVTFRVGYTVGKPVQYVSSVSEDGVSEAIARLNDMMRVRGKPGKDKTLVEWQMICGTAYRIVLTSDDEDDSIPFDFWTADPRQTFVIYRNDIAHTPLCGVYYTIDDSQNYTFHVYTKKDYFKLVGWQSGTVVEASPNSLGFIPIIEYPLNMSRLGCFEIVLPLLDALNVLESNRLDSVEQFVQSLLVAVNCEFPEETTANTIREAGMVALRSLGENKADIKVISEALDQGQTQTLKQSILDAIYEIVGVPSQGNGSTGDSSNNGAIILKNGWQGAETRAQDFESMFSEPERKFLKIVCDICERLSDVTVDPNNIDVKFTRRNYEDLLTKSQTLVTMLGSNLIHPQCAYEACGLFVDTQDAYNMGMEWYERKKQEAAEMMAQTAENEGDEEDETEDKTNKPPVNEKGKADEDDSANRRNKPSK